MEFNNNECWLNWQYEDKLMQYILGSVNVEMPLYRYTTRDSFMRMLSDGTHSMCSLACMNDPSEMDYAQCYLRKKNVNNVKALGNVEQSVDAFITSLTIQNDDLTMWRFYGDDARGVSIEYDAYIVNQDNSPFLISPVSYSNEDGCHPELDYIGNLLNEIIDGRRFHLKRWDLWQHFFKSHEYAIEREVRLLMRCDIFDSETFYNIKRQWITTSDEITAPIIILPFKSGNAENKIIFPLKLKGVLLGPKFPRKETNCLTLNMLVNEKEFFDQNLYVNISKISNYR
jgi:hypothetical protein